MGFFNGFKFKKVLDEPDIKKYDVNVEKMYNFLRKINIPFINCWLNFYSKNGDGEIELSYKRNGLLSVNSIKGSNTKEMNFNEISSLKDILNGQFILKDIFNINEITINLKPSTAEVFPDNGSLYQPFLNNILAELEKNNFLIEYFRFNWNMGQINFDQTGLEYSLFTEEKRLKKIEDIKNVNKNDELRCKQYSDLYTEDKLQQLTELFNNLRTNFEVKNPEPKI